MTKKRQLTEEHLAKIHHSRQNALAVLADKADERAAEVQALTRAGLTTAVIASRLGMSTRTVVRLRSRNVSP